MDENIRRGLQLTELDILAEVDRICRKYRIKYFLACGTLIGAVRHEGFIPWDDDIDIVMPMRDYLRFCKIAADELKNDGYFLQNFCTENVNWVFGKVRKDGTTCIEAGWEKKEIHQGVWIDIFPIIGVKDTHRGIQKVQKHVDFFKRVLHLHQKSTEDKETIKRRLLKAIPDRLCKQAALLYYRMAFKSIDYHKNCFCLYPNTPIEASYESKWFTDAELKKYENDFYPVPIGWKEYLTSVYGDFMTPPPPEKRNSGEHVVGIVDLNKDYREYRKANSTESAL